MNAEAEKLREDAAAKRAEAARSELESGTDGFISQMASRMNARKDELQAEIIEAGGIATFWRWELHKLDGGKVRAKQIEARYGDCWAITDERGKFTGEFVTADIDGAKARAKKGYREVKVAFVAKAKAAYIGGGTGTAGMANMRAAIVAADGTEAGCYGAGDLREQIKTGVDTTVHAGADYDANTADIIEEAI